MYVVAMVVVARIDVAPELGHRQFEILQVPVLLVAVVVGDLKHEIDEVAEGRIGVESVAAAEGGETVWIMLGGIFPARLVFLADFADAPDQLFLFGCKSRDTRLRAGRWGTAPAGTFLEFPAYAIPNLRSLSKLD